ncbi:MAG: bacteriocin fulvocin C-related protein [Cyclobacteriaceae bacterium]
MAKKLMLYIGVLCLIVHSCQKNELLYSCDPDVNQWILENKMMLAEIDRNTFAQVPMKKQIPLFRTFSPEQKVKLWNEKINLLIKFEYLSNDEKTHLLKLNNFLKPYHYSNQNGRDEFNLFADEWEKYARESLMWGDYELYIYSHTLLTEEEIYTLISSSEVGNRSVSPPGHPRPDCECLYDIYCAFGLQLCDKKSGCTTTYGGCGITGNSDCTGYCN